MRVSRNLHATGAEIFAVTFSRDIYIRELKLYSGSLQRVYLGKRIGQLIPDLTDSIKISCKVEDEPVRLITRPPFLAVRHRGNPPRPLTSILKTGSPNTIQRVTEIVKRNTERSCLEEDVDLVIVFDKSTSVERVFEHQKELTLSLIDALPISTDGRIAVSLTSYSDTPTLILPLIAGRSRSEVRREVEDLEHTGGSTATASAVQLAMSDYHRGRRSDAIPIFVLLNDGNSQDPWKLVLQTSDSLDRLGLHRFGAALSNQVYIPELMHYVGLERIYRMEDTAAFVQDIERTAGSLGLNCNQPTTTTSVTTTVSTTTTKG